MGWSCRTDAMNTLQKILKALCIGKSQNVYNIGGKDYLIETSDVEHDDGAITGTIFNVTDWTGRPCNSFRISPDGIVEKGPKAFSLAAEGNTVPKLGTPGD